jgi:preprotein translocase subunit SecG
MQSKHVWKSSWYSPIIIYIWGFSKCPASQISVLASVLVFILLVLNLLSDSHGPLAQSSKSGRFTSHYSIPILSPFTSVVSFLFPIFSIFFHLSLCARAFEFSDRTYDVCVYHAYHWPTLPHSLRGRVCRVPVLVPD